MVARQVDAIQSKVLPTALDRLFGKIDARGLGARERGGDGKRAGVGESIEQAPKTAAADYRAVCALIDKKTGRITRGEIDAKTHAAFLDDRLHRQARISGEQNRRDTLRILEWQMFPEKPAVGQSVCL